MHLSTSPVVALQALQLALTAILMLQVWALRRRSKHIMADLNGLQQAVANETTVEQSAITLLTTLNDQLKAAGTDPAALQALQDQITANTTALAAAVAANTPAAPPAAPTA